MHFLKYFIILPLFVGCSIYSLNYQDKSYITPAFFGLKYDEFMLGKMKAWHIKGNTNNSSLVIFIHGYGENITSHFFYLSWLVNLGVDVALYDYSSEEEGLTGAKLLSDKFKGKYQQVILYGQSLGGHLALEFLTRDEFKNYFFDKVVLDSTFFSFKSLIFGQKGHTLKDSNFALFTLNAKKVLVIHGKEDPVVAFHNGEEIFERLDNVKEFWRVDNGKHLDIYFAHDKVYRSQLLKFLEVSPVKEEARDINPLGKAQALSLFSKEECIKENEEIGYEQLRKMLPILTSQNCELNCSCDYMAGFFYSIGSKKLAQMMYRQKGSRTDELSRECRKRYQIFCQNPSAKN